MAQALTPGSPDVSITVHTPPADFPKPRGFCGNCLDRWNSCWRGRTMRQFTIGKSCVFGLGGGGGLIIYGGVATNPVAAVLAATVGAVVLVAEGANAYYAYMNFAAVELDAASDHLERANAGTAAVTDQLRAAGGAIGADVVELEKVTQATRGSLANLEVHRTQSVRDLSGAAGQLAVAASGVQKIQVLASDFERTNERLVGHLGDMARLYPQLDKSLQLLRDRKPAAKRDLDDAKGDVAEAVATNQSLDKMTAELAVLVKIGEVFREALPAQTQTKRERDDFEAQLQAMRAARSNLDPVLASLKADDAEHDAQNKKLAEAVELLSELGTLQKENAALAAGHTAHGAGAGN